MVIIANATCCIEFGCGQAHDIPISSIPGEFPGSCFHRFAKKTKLKNHKKHPSPLPRASDCDSDSDDDTLCKLQDGRHAGGGGGDGGRGDAARARSKQWWWRR